MRDQGRIEKIRAMVRQLLQPRSYASGAEARPDRRFMVRFEIVRDLSEPGAQTLVDWIQLNEGDEPAGREH